MKTAAILFSVCAMCAHAACADDGELARPNSQKGKIAFIDTQDALSRTNVEAVIKVILETEELNVVYEKAASSDSPDKLKDASKADLAIVIVNDPKKPLTLLAPEDHWAQLNVAALDAGLKTPQARAKFIDGRYRKALLRIFAHAAGGWASNYPGNLMCAAKVSDLDPVKEFVPVDVVDRNTKFLHSIGITPREYATYRQACREGWAPEPTNDAQRVIWNKVRELPSAPIKIKFDPKTDK